MGGSVQTGKGKNNKITANSKNVSLNQCRSKFYEELNQRGIEISDVIIANTEKYWIEISQIEIAQLYSLESQFMDLEGQYYYGTIYNGKPHGFGISYTWEPSSELIDHHRHALYEGWWEDGTRFGPGNMFFKSDAVYAGKWAGGHFTTGTLSKYPNCVYEGRWTVRNGVFSFSGFYEDALKSGDMNLQFQSMKRFIKSGQWTGNVRIIIKNSSEVYEGKWENGQRDGTGTRLIDRFSVSDSSSWTSGTGEQMSQTGIWQNGTLNRGGNSNRSHFSAEFGENIVSSDISN